MAFVFLVLLTSFVFFRYKRLGVYVSINLAILYSLLIENGGKMGRFEEKLLLLLLHKLKSP